MHDEGSKNLSKISQNKGGKACCWQWLNGLWNNSLADPFAFLPIRRCGHCEVFPVKDVTISAQPIELYKLLKFEGMVASGGESKHVISEGLVLLNGEVETQKRKKIVVGDIVEFDGEKIRIQLA